MFIHVINVYSLHNTSVFVVMSFLESFGKPRVWVDALSQNAFDTGAGLGLMVPYSSFMTRNHGIVRYATLIPATNNLVRYCIKSYPAIYIIVRIEIL